MLRDLAPQRPAVRGTTTRPDIDGHALAVTAGLTLFAFVVVRTAWLCDDSYITFRAIDNWVHGYGLRWNVDERVQAFTHPLWLLVVSPFYAVTREAYFTPLAISMALAFAAVWLFLTRIASSLEMVLIAIAALVSSKAFVEFATSGLENPLTTFLLALFFVVYWSAAPRVWLWIVAGLLMLNRLDTGLLVVPLLAVEVARRPWRQSVRYAAIGFAPLVAWEIFAIVYYGFPVPNTAYAKLQTGIEAPALIGQGLLYFVDSIAQDPITLLTIATAAVIGLRTDARATWPIMAGIGLYLAYVVRAGGDFMSGRFLVAPLFCALAAFARLRWTPGPSTGWIVAALALIGCTAATHPPLTSGADTFAAGPVYGVSGVADERSFDYPNTGLLRWTREHPLPTGEWVEQGIAIHNRHDAVVRANIGLYGYFAGPTVHIVDAYALSDPLIARIPASRPWRIGHFQRPVPDGYLDSIRAETNLIVDPEVADLYRQIKLITQGPLWSRSRWRAIRRINLGW